MGKNLKGRECGKGIYQRKDGKYSARYYAKDGKRKEKYFNTLPEAKGTIVNGTSSISSPSSEQCASVM